MKLHRTIIVVLSACVLFSAIAASGYTVKKSSSVWSRSSDHGGKVTTEQIRGFERQLTSFFRVKSDPKKLPTSLIASPRPTQTDFFKIARYWNLLSADFRNAYLGSAIIPSSMNMYVSPRGMFEVYYATSGNDSVDQTDSYGYGGGNRRTLTSGPNGVPDYIDEVAWAFDSAWSMEIDRFQFVQPNPFIDKSHQSTRYKVIVRDVDFLYGAGTYGMTTPTGSAQGAAMGQQSYIELRNEWRDPAWAASDTSTHTDYPRHPEWGARVTAVHEFFHGIQFAMTRSYTGATEAFVDDFPETWLEATGVLMEQLGFADIKDYLQYAGGFFDDPTLDIFSGYNDVYTTSLLAMYLYQHASAAPDIAFVKNMFFNNYRSPVGFGDDLLHSARQSGGSWADVLGGFHTASFFTGARSGLVAFLPDASLLPKWSYAIDAPDAGYSVKKDVDPSSMQMFSFAHRSNHADVLHLEFFGDSLAKSKADTNPLWNVHCILQTTNASADSIFEVPVAYSGQADISIDAWSRFDNALLIVSNTHGDSAHGATLVFEPCPITLKNGDSATYPCRIIAPLSPGSLLEATVIAREDLACSLSISAIQLTARQTSGAAKKRLASVNGFSSLGFPMSWTKKAFVGLLMREDTLACGALENKYGVSLSAFSIFKWDDTAAAWGKTGSGVLQDGLVEWRLAPAAPGVYGLFCQVPVPADSFPGDSITAFPNPVHLRSKAIFKVHGAALLQLLVYDVNGVLVFRAENRSPVSELQWPMISAGRSVAPGMYYAVIGSKDTVTKGMKQRKRKVVIVP